MANPFDDDSGTFHALVNAEGQYSLWPVFVPVPQGWEIRLDNVGRDTCLAYIEEHWTDMRPASLVAAMEADAQARTSARGEI